MSGAAGAPQPVKAGSATTGVTAAGEAGGGGGVSQDAAGEMVANGSNTGARALVTANDASPVPPSPLPRRAYTEPVVVK